MPKALVIGIDHYAHAPRLHGCVHDASAVATLLETHADGSPNFDVTRLLGRSSRHRVTREQVKQAVRELFSGRTEIALLYFAGHGHIEETGGYLLTSESRTGDDGLALGDVLQLANNSKARNRIVLLDSCHSGIAGNPPNSPAVTMLAEGTTILTASTEAQYATEENGQGTFTGLLVDALEGAAGDLLGNVTPAAVYAHIDQSLNEWQQRPVFKTNIERFVPLRKVEAPLSLKDLREIRSLFPTPEHQIKLDPSFEPDSERDTGRKPDPANMKTFAILQRLRAVNLVEPVGEDHMYYAAMRRKACRLTPLGRHYWRLRDRKRF